MAQPLLCLLGYCYNPKLHHTCLPGIRPTHIPSLPKHLLRNLFENPFELSQMCPNSLLHALERWQAYYCTRWNAGRPTTTRVYLTKHKNKKVVDGTKRYGSVN
jgi:hypothetical protein